MSGRHKAASTIRGFANNDFSDLSFPEFGVAMAHLREVLANETYESFARAAQHMTTAAMAAYALEQIDQARAARQQT